MSDAREILDKVASGEMTPEEVKRGGKPGCSRRRSVYAGRAV